MPADNFSKEFAERELEYLDELERATPFKGFAEPMGARVTLHPADTPRARVAKAFFDKLLFRYFEQLNSGQAGWGVSFVEWLETYGWKLIGFTTYERTQALFKKEP